MNPLAKRITEMALRLTALSPQQASEPQVLDAIEQFAKDLLKEVSAARLGDSYAVGETTGHWQAIRPPRPQ